LGQIRALLGEFCKTGPKPRQLVSNKGGWSIALALRTEANGARAGRGIAQAGIPADIGSSTLQRSNAFQLASRERWPESIRFTA
jgi:hypothetical protein